MTLDHGSTKSTVVKGHFLLLLYLKGLGFLTIQPQKKPPDRGRYFSFLNAPINRKTSPAIAATMPTYAP